MASYKQVSSPIFLPLSLAEAKEHMRIIGVYDDTTVLALLQAAAQKVQDYTWRPICQQSWEMHFDSVEIFTDVVLMVNKYPVISIDSVKYYNTSNELTTLDTAEYEVDIISDPVRVKLLKKPLIKERFGAFVIAFKSGYMGYKGTSITPSGVSGNVLTSNNHGLVNNQPVIPTTKGASHLKENGLYYVINATTNTFQVSELLGGSAATITGQITGLVMQGLTDCPSPIKSAIKLIMAHLYEHREDVVVGASVAELPQASEYLLAPYVNKYY
jgi:uncharacterized phiE125 gp8 family phage protein